MDDVPLGDLDDDELEAEALPRMLTDRYRLERLLAKGGMGRVYLATQLPLERRVALKLLVAPPNLRGDFRKRFLLEASVCAKLTHPNIVVVHDYGEAPSGDLFMAMELLEGRSLSQVLREEGPMSAERATRTALHIARALRQAHREGLAHRDLKPGNVFLERRVTDGDHEEEVVKVLDFGLVKVFEESRPAVERDLTQGGMMLGSPRYMSPEQITCEDVDARSDIYSLGVLLFTLVCGRPPFIGNNPIEILTQHLQKDPPTFAEAFRQSGQVQHHPAPAELQSVVFRCMRKEKDARYQTIDELIRELKIVLELVGDSEGPTSSSMSMPRLPLDAGTLSQDTHPTPLPIDMSDSIPMPSATRGGAGWKIGALVAAVVVGALIAMLWPSPPEPVAAPTEPVSPVQPEEPEAVVEATEPTTPAAPTHVRVTVTSEPSGAEVMSGGVLIGTTPVTHPFPPTTGGARRVFELSLEGHRDARVSERLEGEEAAVHVRFEPEVSPEPTRTTMTVVRAETTMRSDSMQADSMRSDSMQVDSTRADSMAATTSDTTPMDTAVTPMSTVVRDTPRVPIVD